MPTTLQERDAPMRFGTLSDDAPSGTGWIALAVLLLVLGAAVAAVLALL